MAFQFANVKAKDLILEDLDNGEAGLALGALLGGGVVEAVGDGPSGAFGFGGVVEEGGETLKAASSPVINDFAVQNVEFGVALLQVLLLDIILLALATHDIIGVVESVVFALADIDKPRAWVRCRVVEVAVLDADLALAAEFHGDVIRVALQTADALEEVRLDVGGIERLVVEPLTRVLALEGVQVIAKPVFVDKVAFVAVYTLARRRIDDSAVDYSRDHALLLVRVVFHGIARIAALALVEGVRERAMGDQGAGLDGVGQFLVGHVLVHPDSRFILGQARHTDGVGGGHHARCRLGLEDLVGDELLDSAFLGEVGVGEEPPRLTARLGDLGGHIVGFLAEIALGGNSERAHLELGDVGRGERDGGICESEGRDEPGPGVGLTLMASHVEGDGHSSGIHLILEIPQTVNPDIAFAVGHDLALLHHEDGVRVGVGPHHHTREPVAALHAVIEI